MKSKTVHLLIQDVVDQIHRETWHQLQRKKITGAIAVSGGVPESVKSDGWLEID